MKERIRAHFAAHRDEYRRYILDLLTELVAQRTVNAGKARLDECPGQEVPGEETRVVDVLIPYLEALGVQPEVHALHPRRANLLATMGQGGRLLAVGLHSDIVPPGDGWGTDPYVVTERDGMLYGRGVLDDKGPLASAVAAMKLLRDAGIELGGRFQLAVIAAEEHHEPGEPDPGIGFLMAEGLLKPDLAVIPDIGENLRGIDIAEKGRLVIDVTAFGRQAHGSTPERGINAVYAAARLIGRIEACTLPHEEHPVLGRPTINLGLIQGGAAANIVPGECRFTLDVRYVPGMTAAGIVAFLEGLGAEAGGRFAFDVKGDAPPHAVSADHPLVHAIQRCAEPVLGFVPQAFGMGGGTFAKAFNLGGIPAVGWGPGDDAAFHVADEYVPVEQLVDFAELLALLAADLLA
jgi:acetylornithine deacetylase/succinyl-diaminopimelate desuccinylase family protein